MIKPGDLLVYSTLNKAKKAMAIAIEFPSGDAIIQIKVFELKDDWKTPINRQKNKENIWSFDTLHVGVYYQIEIY